MQIFCGEYYKCTAYMMRIVLVKALPGEFDTHEMQNSASPNKENGRTLCPTTVI